MALIVLAYPLLTPMSKLLLFAAATIIAINVDSLAATLAVLPGTSIQAKIDQAQPGDVIAIFGGTYAEDLSISKSVRLVEVNGQDVIVTGRVHFIGLVNPPAFEGFVVGSAGRGITVTDSTGLLLRGVDARPGSGIVVAGASEVSLQSCLEVGVSQTGGSLTAIGCTISGNFETSTGAQKTVAFRTTVKGDNNWRSKKAWFGYCDTRSFNYYDQTDGKVVVVGSRIDRQGGEANGIYLAGSSNSFLIANNLVLGVGYANAGDAENGLDGRGGANSYLIANNYFNLQFYGEGPSWYGQSGTRGDGIYVRDSANAKILNNIVVGARYGISAPFGATAQNNLYWASPWGSGSLEANGVIAQGTIYADPKFVADQAPVLAADSPCHNAGVEDPIYNNRDGSRNTIGPSGGTLYDPDARTTENPVVISFDLGPEQVLEGEATDIILSNGQAVSQP